MELKDNVPGDSEVYDHNIKIQMTDSAKAQDLLEKIRLKLKDQGHNLNGSKKLVTQ